MTPLLLRTGALADLSLSLAEATDQFHTLLPLFNSHAAQVAIVLGLPLVLHECGTLIADAARQAFGWWKTWWGG